MKKMIAFILAFCLLASIPVFATDSTSNMWDDKWELVKNASFEGESIQINPDGEIKHNTTLGSNFECEFKLQMKGLNKSTKENGLMLASGSYRFYAVIKKDVIRYMPPDWSTARTWAEIPFNVGEEEHTYRFIVHGGKCELFIDGLFLAEMNILASTQNYSGFWSKDIIMIVKDFKTKKLPSLNVEVKEKIPVEPFFIDFNDGDDLSDWSISKGFSMHDGVMECIGVDSSAPSMSREVCNTKEYIFEMRMKHPEYGYNGFDTYLQIGGYEVAFLINPNRSTDVRTKTAFAQGGEMTWGDEWKVVKVETYDQGRRAILSFDDVPYMDFDLRSTDYAEDMIYIGGSQRTSGTKATEFSIDWIRFTPKPAKDEIKIISPMDGAEYLEGADIELKTEVDPSLDIPQVEYRLHGNTVAIGKAPDYKAVLSNVTAGNYDVTASYGDYESHKSTFVVKKLTKITLDVEGKDSVVKVKPEVFDELNQIAKVEYYLDGTLVEVIEHAPFDAEIKGVTSANHKISAKFYDKNNVLICKEESVYTPSIPDDSHSESYANDITYQVTGESGTAEVKVNNGRHSLTLKHEGDKVSYLTKEGMEEYSISAKGNWEILTDAYIADVYRNGQLAFSYIMPKTDEVGESVTEDGLTVANLAVSIPEYKTNYFLKTNYAGNGMETYEISNLPYDYNLDFVASKEDNFRFAVSDGDFHLDFEFEDGKIWAQDVDNEGMHPKRRYQADVPDVDGNIYYRAEVAGGFMRLYADGKWLTTVRLSRSSDPDALAIETKDTLKYVSLCANEDLYLYTDNFDGSGENPSLSYWELKETTASVDEKGGQLTLEATEGNEGRAEINASSGYAVVEATLDLSECEGGAYILFDVASNATEGKAGYNMETKQFEMVRKTRFGETKLTEDADIDIANPVTMRVELEQRRGGETVYFYVNDALVLTDKGGIKERGAVGLVFDGGTLKVNDFSYRGDGHPVITSKEWTTDISTQYNMIEKDNEWVLMDWQSKLRSTDYGKTWTNETYANTMESCHTVRLQSGAVLVAKRVWGEDKYGFRTTTYHSGISYDDGETWEEQGPIAGMGYAEATCNRLKQGQSGRVYFVMSRRGAHDDGWCRVYWSDDEGKTWKEGMELGMSNIGHQCCEPEVIEMPDGETRLYFRNETGMLIYITSDDYGETWDFTPHKTSILMPSTHFTIEQDPYEPNTFYAIYTYSNTNEHGRDQGPRCRLAVSVSYDGGNEWQFVGTLFEEEIEMFYATRGNDVTTMMNININVAKDHIVATIPFNSEEPVSNRHWLLRVVTLDKGVVKALAKPEKLHTRPATIEQSAPVIEETMARTIVVTNESTNALVGGKIYKNVNHKNSLPVDIVAEFLGASVGAKSAESVVLRQGEFSATFGADELSVADGTVYLSIDAIAEKFNLHICKDGNLIVVGQKEKWSIEQLRTFRYSLNLFADSDREYVNNNINPEDTWEAFIEYLEVEYPKQIEKMK